MLVICTYLITQHIFHNELSLPYWDQPACSVHVLDCFCVFVVILFSFFLLISSSGAILWNHSTQASTPMILHKQRCAYRYDISISYRYGFWQGCIDTPFLNRYDYRYTRLSTRGPTSLSEVGPLALCYKIISHQKLPISQSFFLLGCDYMCPLTIAEFSVS